jgi:hypothetical protein
MDHNALERRPTIGFHAKEHPMNRPRHHRRLSLLTLLG